MFDEILHLEIRPADLKSLSPELADLILSLLQKDPDVRLGSEHGFEEIKRHPFFAIDGLSVEEYWEAVERKYINPPEVLIPQVDEDYHQIETFTINSYSESEIRLCSQGSMTFEQYTQEGLKNSYI